MLPGKEQRQPTECRYGVLFLMALYALMSIFEVYINGVLGMISRYYILALIVILIMTMRRAVIVFPQVILALWYIYYILSSFWTSTSGMSQMSMYFMTVSSMTVLAIVMMAIKLKKDDVGEILYFYQLASLLLGILGVFFSRQYGFGTRSSLVLFGIMPDSNNLVAMYGVASAIGMCDLFNSRKHILADVLSILINYYDIVMTGSRSGLVLIALQLAIVLFLSEEKKSPKQNAIKWLIVLIAVLLAVAVLSSIVPEEILDRILGRGNLKFTDGTGREERWHYGLELWLNKGFLFGCGWGYYECHNTFITMLVDVGLIGTTLFMILLIWTAAKGLMQRNVMALMLLVTGVVPGFFIGAQNKRFFWNGIIFSIILVLSERWLHDEFGAEDITLDNSVDQKTETTI